MREKIIEAGLIMLPEFTLYIATVMKTVGYGIK